MSNITKWLWPVKGTKVGDVTPERWYTGPHSQGLHSGIDVHVPGISGYEVLASRKGKVVMLLSGCKSDSGFSSLGRDCAHSGCANPADISAVDENGVVKWFCNDTVGNMIILEHDVEINGTTVKRYSQYCHLSSFIDGIKKDDEFEQGDTIGYVGSTGMSTGAHLHFSISTGISSWGGERINNNPYDIDSPYEPGEFEYFEEIPTPTEKVKVSFYDDLPENGGKHMANKDTEYTVGGKYGSFPDPGTKTGYTFESWYYPSGDGYGFVKTYSDVTKDRTKLYAHWVPDTVEVTFYDDLAGNGGEVVEKRKYLVGLTYGKEYENKADTFPDPTEFNKEGYKFDKWYTETGGYVEHYSVVTRDRTKLYAHWTPKTYDITLYPGYGTNVQLSGTYTVTTENAYGAALPTLTRCGYTHIGWKRSDVNGDTTVYNSKSTVTKEIKEFTAIWEAKKMKVTYNYGIDGVKNVVDENVVFGNTYGTNVPSVSTANTVGDTENLIFSGWYHPEVEDDSKVMMDTDHTLEAHWKKKSFKVSFDPGTECDFAEDVASIDACYLDRYGCLPVPKSNKSYVFDHWSLINEDGSDGLKVSSGTVVTRNYEHTLRAHWNKEKTVTFEYYDENDIKVSNEYTMEYGKPYITNHIPQKKGYDIKFMFDDVTSIYNYVEITSRMPVIYEHPTKITAYYIAKSVTVIIDTRGGNFSNAELNEKCWMKLLYDMPYSITKPTKEGYTFTGWFYDEACTQPVGSTDVITNPEPHTLYAGWKKNITLTFDPGNSTFTEAVEPKTVYLGEPYGELPEPKSANHYQFYGWVIGDEVEVLEQDRIVENEADHTAVAYWTTMRTLTLDYNDGTGARGYMTVGFGGKYFVLPTPTREGYNFAGWFFGDDTAYAGVQCTRTLTVLPEHPDTVYAKWEAAADTETE